MPPTFTLVSAGGATQTLTQNDLLSPAARDRVRAEANRWIKNLRLVRYGDATMRDRFTYRGDSLWWFTELYLHKMRRLEQALSTIGALEAAVDIHAPARVSVTGATAAEAHAARSFAVIRALPLDVIAPASGHQASRKGFLVGVSALLSRLRPVPHVRPSRARVAAFVHTAFWKSGGTNAGRESYIGDVLEALDTRVQADDVRLIGVGPRRTFSARRWWDPVTRAAGGPHVTPVEHLAPRAALGESLALWRNRHELAGAVVAGPDIRSAGVVGRYDLWPVLSAELSDAARVQWTWSARAMDEARAALVATEPDVALTYAEAGGWGRALVLEARRLSIPTVGLQHGFIYRHWLNYQHEVDEMLSSAATGPFPYPTKTVLFDRYAGHTLESSGHFPSDALTVAGSPRLDELVSRLHAVAPEREGLRRALGVGTDEHLLVLAAKATEIRAHLPALFDAVRHSPGVRLVVKPHPAESAEAYRQYLHDGDRITVEGPDSDLGRLLAIADALVTMNSTVAIDALVLGVPALVVGLPNNLSPFVEAGVMAGADGAEIRTAITALLYDRSAREALVQRGGAFAARYDMRADGNSAARAADEVLRIANRG